MFLVTAFDYLKAEYDHVNKKISALRGKSDYIGDIEDVDGVMRITKIRLHYRFRIPAGLREKVERVLARYAEKCPAVTVHGLCAAYRWEPEDEHRAA